MTHLAVFGVNILGPAPARRIETEHGELWGRVAGRFHPGIAVGSSGFRYNVDELVWLVDEADARRRAFVPIWRDAYSDQVADLIQRRGLYFGVPIDWHPLEFNGVEWLVNEAYAEGIVEGKQR